MKGSKCTVESLRYLRFASTIKTDFKLTNQRVVEPHWMRYKVNCWMHFIQFTININISFFTTLLMAVAFVLHLLCLISSGVYFFDRFVYNFDQRTIRSTCHHCRRNDMLCIDYIHIYRVWDSHEILVTHNPMRQHFFHKSWDIKRE